MNDFETTKAGAAGISEAEELRERSSGLERQITLSLVALVILSCSLCAFIGIQWKQARAELANFKPAAARVIETYQQREKPAIDVFLARLGEFGRTNADFRPVLIRYGIAIPSPVRPGEATPAPPAVAAPKPAPASKK